MTAIDLNWYLFGAVVAAFTWFGFSASTKERSTKDYFHSAELHKNVVSLTATNITLGTGLVYLVVGAQHNGLLMFLVPVAVWLGYVLQGLYLEQATHISARTGRNFLAGVNEQLSEATGRPSPFARIVSASLVSVFVLVLAFEIFASSKVVAPFLFREVNSTAEAWMSVIIFGITVLYTILGGVRAVFAVDVIQVPLVCIFLPVFIWTTVPDAKDPGRLLVDLSQTLRIDMTALSAIAIACMNAVATQFYSILNWGAVSNVAPRQQRHLLNRVGFLTAVVLTVFVLVGLLHRGEPGVQVWQDITKLYAALSSQSGPLAFALSGILLLGMTSILLSTTDAIVISAILFWYDNVVGGDSLDSKASSTELRRIRTIGAVSFGLCFAVLLTINYLQPDPFYLLLSMAGGVVVFAPMIAAAGYVCSLGREAAQVFSARIIYSYFAVFILAGVVDIVLLWKRSTLVSYVGLVAFLVALVLSLSVVAKGRMRSRGIGPSGASLPVQVE